MKIGSPFGIGVHVHWSFLILLGIIGLSSLSSGGVAGAVFSITLIVALFTCVVLHELGHSLAARAFGIQTRHITLYPIGGVAQLERMPRKPHQELLIAVAGPAVNVVIAILLIPVVMVVGFPETAEDVMRPGFASLLVSLLGLNIFLVLFNMVPAFPMDGGRVLRALLAFSGDFLWATNVASRIGQGFAVLFFLGGVLGIFGVGPFSPMLMLIAVFIFFAAAAERRNAYLQDHFSRIPRPQPVPTPAGPMVVINEDDWEILPPEPPRVFFGDRLEPHWRDPRFRDGH